MDITSNNASSIDLNGFLGEFKSPGSNYTIKFFSTIANTKDSGYQTFLKKLEPLRDKVTPASIKDLGTLLQRDLSDIRIANELLPYLINSRNNPSHVAFFPSVLCVLMPKNFLEDKQVNRTIDDKFSEIKYPNPTVSLADAKGNITTQYGDGWEIFEFFDKSTRTRLGKIRIFDEKSDFLVLDGQHRTNAFRAAAGVFPTSGSIYESFYLPKPTSSGPLEADLPVTLIWFETSNEIESKIKPDLISRKLFIDVNNSAKSISKSRLILLNDSSPNNLLTRFFYTYLSTNYGFSLNQLSLFHFGFDFPDDLSSKKTQLCPLNLFNPEMIDAGIDWMFFLKNSKYIPGKSSANRDDNNDWSNCDKFLNDTSSKYFELPENKYGEEEKRVKSLIDLKDLESKTTSINSIIYDLFNEFPLVKIQIDATKKLNDLCIARSKPFDVGGAVDCFNKAYLGGEGIYYSILKQGESSPYYMYITQSKKGDLGINETFYNLRFATGGFKKVAKEQVDSAYGKLSTLVFAPGYFRMDRKMSPKDAKNEFVKRLSLIKNDTWIIFLTEFMNEMFKSDLSPKLWPIFSNMLLRLIQKKKEFFDNDDYRLSSPEAYIIKNNFDAKSNEYRVSTLGTIWGATDYSSFSRSTVSGFINNTVAELDELFEKLGLEKDDTIDYASICKESLKKRCKP